MTTLLILLQLLIVLCMIFIGAKVGGIGLGIYGMVGVFVLVFVFGMEPGAIPIDVMLIIVSVITASASLQAAGGLDYMVNQAARFLKKHHLRLHRRRLSDRHALILTPQVTMEWTKISMNKYLEEKYK